LALYVHNSTYQLSTPERMFPNVVVVVVLLVGHQNLLFLLSTAHTFTVRWYWRLEIFDVLAVASSASWRFSFHLRRNLFLSPLCSSFFCSFLVLWIHWPRPPWKRGHQQLYIAGGIYLRINQINNKLGFTGWVKSVSVWLCPRPTIHILQ